MVVTVSTRKIAAEILLFLERERVPIGHLDEILSIVRESALYFTPIVGHGPLDQTLEEGNGVPSSSHDSEKIRRE